MPNEKGFLIFVVEDDEWYGHLLEHTLHLNPDHDVVLFNNGKDCLSELHRKPDIITLDYRLPDMQGFEVLKEIKETNPEIEVVVISEQDKISTAVDLLKNGAYDYIVKSKDIRDRLLNTIQHIKENATLKSRIDTLEKEVRHKYAFENLIIGQSEVLRKVFSLIEKAVNNTITVTITGETGTGKELVAKAIHYNSVRRNMPFVAVNMAAIPKELAESELFGHEKGSFTGANARRTGKFEEANGGTIFLDEIGEMDLTMQSKILRVLQEKEVTRVGSNKSVKFDARVIVATNRNLNDEVKKGNFREDLYFRLFGLQIELPPLRERDRDILHLSSYFIKNFCKENNLEIPHISSSAQHKLLSYMFPGNVRELKAVTELAVVMSNGKTIEPEDISFSGKDVVTDVLSEELTMRQYEHKILHAYLKKYENNIRLVADKLDIGQSTIYRMLKENHSELIDK
jgi:two-component system, NtrC family, response regulator AtoC